MKKSVLIFVISFLIGKASLPVCVLARAEDNISRVLLPDNFSELLLEEKNANQNAKNIKKMVKNQEKNNKKNGRKNSKKEKYHNGNLSKDILINEIFPHAKKNDRRSEWIELYNNGKENVNLGNWRLDDSEGGSKPYVFPDTITIKPGSFLVIAAPQSKIALNNEHDQVRLFDYMGKEIDHVEYEQAAAGKSYVRTIVTKEDGQKSVQWFFDDENTPGKPNPDLQEVRGSIVNEPVWGDQYMFIFLTSKNEQKNIIFHENLIQGPLAKTTFIKGVKAKLLVKKTQKPDTFELKQYEIFADQKPSEKNKNILGKIIISGIFIIGAIVWGVRKFLW